jgi:azurin
MPSGLHVAAAKACFFLPMKIRVLVVPLFAALFVAGCGKNEPSATAAAPAAPGSAPAAAPAGARQIDVTANDQMKFMIGDKQSDPSGSLTIEAKAGEPLKIVMTNAGTLPKEAMGHNFVILKPGSDPLAFSVAAAAAKDTDYIPTSLKDQVVAHTAVLGPRKSEEINVTLQAGEYPFLCSFPAHAQVGMRGKIVVK